MTVDVAARAGYMTQMKVIRRVRTQAGVRRYKQPIGSIIINDGILIGLTEISNNPKTGVSIMQGENGKKYNIRLEEFGSGKGHKRYVGREGDTPGKGRTVFASLDEVEVLAEIAREVQVEAGMDTRLGGPALPGGKPKREGWSENVVQAVGDELHGWGNTATDNGNQPLADELWDIATRLSDGYTPHRDLRVTRHELEQLKKRDDLNLDGADPSGGPGATFGGIVDNAISDFVTEGGLPKRYNEEVEAAYVAEVLAEHEAGKATANATPRPIKPGDIQKGQWVRELDPKSGEPKGDWFKVNDTGMQSTRSWLIGGHDRQKKRVTHYRRTNRDKYETVGSPKAYEIAQGIRNEDGSLKDAPFKAEGEQAAQMRLAANVLGENPFSAELGYVSGWRNRLNAGDIEPQKVADSLRKRADLMKRDIDSGATRNPTAAYTQRAMYMDAANILDPEGAKDPANHPPDSHSRQDQLKRRAARFKRENDGAETPTPAPAVPTAGGNTVTPSDGSTTVVKPQMEGADANLPSRYESAVTFARGTLALTDRAVNRDMAVIGAELGGGNITADEAVERLRVLERRTKNAKAKKAVQGAIWAIENVRANSGERKPTPAARAEAMTSPKVKPVTPTPKPSVPDVPAPKKVPKITPASGGLRDSNLQKADSEYPDYEKYVGDNGRSFYLEDGGNGNFVVLDENDNELAEGNRQQVFAAMAKLGKGTASASTATPAADAPLASMSVAQLRKLARAEGLSTATKLTSKRQLVAAIEKMRGKRNSPAGDPALSNIRATSSEYDGWEKYLGPSDTPYYLRQEGGSWVAVDGNDEDVVPAGTRASVLAALDKLATPKTTGARAAALTKPRVKKTNPAGLKKVANAYEGWDRYKGPDGKTYDVGYDETDNRWYATGKGGWDEVVADAETRDAVVEKLSAAVAPDKPETVFSPNTPQVVPQVVSPEEEAERRAVLERLTVLSNDVAAQRQSGNNAQLIKDLNDLRVRVLTGKATRGEALIWLRGRQDSRKNTRERAALTAAADDLAGIPKSPIAGMTVAQIEQARENRSPAVVRSVIGTPVSSGQPRPTDPRVPGPIPGNMKPGDAARSVWSMQSEFQPSTAAYNYTADIGRALDEGKITTPEAARVLRAQARVLGVDTREGQRFNQQADHITATDLRSREQIAADATAKRQSAIQQAQAAANVINQRAKLTPQGAPRRELPLGSLTRDLDTGTVPVMRNGKPLKDADRKLLHMEENSNGPTNRLKDPSSINLYNRRQRLVGESQEAGQALRDRATENYLSGMTHSAAWKEAIETAEQIKVPDHYVSHRGTRDGRGEHVVVRSLPSGGSEEVVVIRPKTTDHSGFQAGNIAKGRMHQENTLAREAATRSVPVSGPVRDAPGDESGSVGSTAGAAGVPAAVDPVVRSAEVQSNIQLAYDDVAGPNRQSTHYVNISRLRDKLDALGYSRAEQDDALRAMNQIDGVSIIAEANQKTLTDEVRRGAVNIGNQDKHLISIRQAGLSSPQDLNSMTNDQRIQNLQRYTQTGQDYRRGVVENLSRARIALGKGETEAANGYLLTAEVSAGLRDPNEVRAYWDAIDKRKAVQQEMIAAANDLSIDAAARGLTGAGAKKIAKTDPVRFMRLVAYREFRMDRDFRLKDNDDRRLAYEELQGYADRMETAASLGTLRAEIDQVQREVRMRHGGLTYGVHSTVTTLINVLSKEYDG